MTIILVPLKRTPRQVKQAETRAVEFRPNRYTSGSANLDDMIALNKAVVLCEVHTRKFSPQRAHYRAHPDKRLRKVMGNCDVCKQFGLSWLFLNEKDAYEEQKKLERFQRACEYGQLFKG